MRVRGQEAEGDRWLRFGCFIGWQHLPILACSWAGWLPLGCAVTGNAMSAFRRWCLRRIDVVPSGNSGFGFLFSERFLLACALLSALSSPNWCLIASFMIRPAGEVSRSRYWIQKEMSTTGYAQLAPESHNGSQRRFLVPPFETAYHKPREPP
jgi:hypothetical protein